MKKRILSFSLCVILSFSLFSCVEQDNNIGETETANMDDNDPYTFSTVSELKNAIKKNPKHYNNKDITIQGTIMKVDSDTLLVDFSGSTLGAMERYEIKKDSSRYIAIVIPDDILSAVLETGDYIKLSGTVRISEGEIYLDNCEYTMIATRDER